jgi:signal transduction histidine kinase
MFIKKITDLFWQKKPTLDGIKCTARRYTILYLFIFFFFVNILSILEHTFLGWQLLEQLWLTWYMLLLTFIAFLITTVLYTFELNNIQQELTHTIRSLIHGIRNLSPQEPWQKLCIHELTCDDELQEVVSAINSKSEQIQSHIDYLKKLIGYMQHEFSTPLAIAQLHIDRAGKKDADVLAWLAWVKGEIEHMGWLVTAMASLVEVDVSLIEKESCNMSEIITKITGQLLEIYPSTSFTIHAKEEVLVQANKQYVWSICRNIIENAVKHGSDDVIIHINKDFFEITDTWDGIAASELEHVWLPFWKKTKKTWYTEWFWLGLSLVKLLITKLGRDIEILQPTWSWVIFRISY